MDLPSPYTSWVDALAYFEKRNLNVQDFTTLLGNHQQLHLNRLWCVLAISGLMNLKRHFKKTSLFSKYSIELVFRPRFFYLIYTNLTNRKPSFTD